MRASAGQRGVSYRVKSQWMLKITAYADKPYRRPRRSDYIERVATSRRTFDRLQPRRRGELLNTTAGDSPTVYTTRCDTLFGATYMPFPGARHGQQWLDKASSRTWMLPGVYRAEAARKSDFERSELNKEKTGSLEGVMGINPSTTPRSPSSFPTTSCPPTAPAPSWLRSAHDTRDWEFAKKFGLPIIEVVQGSTPSNSDEAAFTDGLTGTSGSTPAS